MLSSRGKKILILGSLYLIFILSGTESYAQANIICESSLYYYLPDFYIQYSLFSTLSLFNPSIWMMMDTPLPMQIDSTSKDTVNKDTSHTMPFNYTSPPFERLSPDHPKTNIERHPKGFENTSTIDKNLDSLTTNFSVDKINAGYSYNIGLDDYLDMRKKGLQYSLWDSLMNRYDLDAALSGGDLARLISQSTGVTIPVPPNPIFGIFGKPTISINVQGEVNLTLGWRWDSQKLGTVSAFGQTQSTPIFNQNIKVNVSAKIGDKLKLTTDWSTQRQFDYDNKFKIGFEGEDDDIVKLVELGNVDLPLTTSLIRGGETLFGLRSDFQFGPLYLKTLFSQRRGEVKTIDVRGGTSKMPFQIRAYDYAKNHFFLDTAYRSVYRDYFKFTTGIIPTNAQALRVKEIEVWESETNIQNAAMYSTQAIAYADLKPIQAKASPPQSYPANMLHVASTISGKIEMAQFVKLDSTRYRLDYNLGTLTILNLRSDRYYAVAYRVEGQNLSNDDDEYYGNLTSISGKKDTLVLKLIYVPNLIPSDSLLWARQMKNIYSINATNVNLTDTRISIWYLNQNNDSSDVLPGAPDKVVTILGVDRVTNATGNPPPDGEFDMNSTFFNSERGEITFPSLEPFREGLRKYFSDKGTPQLAEQFVFNEVYDTTYEVARRNTGRDRFVISGEVSGSATNKIPLGAFNLAPGSVKVTLDGVPLREFEDYIVDYYSGMLTIRNQRAALPNANLKITYEANDVFNISTKTLAGIRGDYQLFKSRKVDAGLGFTLMYYNQSAVIDRVRLGEEPLSNTMLGFDTKLQWDTPWLTKMLDALPFYDTKAKSSLGIRGEWAITFPDPNKRTSEVASDLGEPVVYIDDFEGAQQYISLGLSATQWQHSSQPVDSTIAPTDVDRALFRGKMYWYQYFIPRVPIKEVYPQKDIVQGLANISPLQINFNPALRGIYNKNLQFLDTLDMNYNPSDAFGEKPENRQKIWAGMERLFSSFNTNFDNENIDYIEIMMKIDAWEPGRTQMFIDLGMISEDIIPNHRLDTEDGITAANPVPNGIIDPGEDIGIDAEDDVKERTPGEYPVTKDPNGDPARDDYTFDFAKDDNLRVDADFVNYNNFEGNSKVSELGQFPDTEILNKNNGQTISLNDSYFTYEVNLTPDANSNSQIVGGANNWFLYRIPIRKPQSSVGNPSFANIQYIRVWFKGGLFIARIADWRLVGAQWQRVNNFEENVPPADSVLQVSFVNIDENSGAPDYYTMPPGVTAPRQLNNPDPNQDIRLNEQSIAISVRNLRYGEERIATRIFQQLDIFYYKYLKFFVHGDGSMPDNVVPGAVPKAYTYIRFGTDSSNYYEYRRPLLRGWQDINIVLTQLTAIKQVRGSSGILLRQVFPVPGDQFATFAIKGNPTLTRIQFFGFGISNPAERYPNDLNTTMWVDELRLVSPERRSDWGGVGSIDLKLADLGNINANISHTNPNFHMLEDRFGNRISSTNWSVSMQGNLEKFAPLSFKNMKIPISYNHSEYMQNPEFVANNDVNLLDAANAAAERAKQDAINSGLPPDQAQMISDKTRNETIERSQTLRVLDSWALTGVRLGIPVSSWLIDDTFNKLTLGYSYSQEYDRDPVVAERFSWQWIFTTQYSIQFSNLLTVEPMKWAKEKPVLDEYKEFKINFWPSNFSAGFNLTRRRVTEQSRFLETPSPVLREFSAQRQAQFTWKFTENSLFNPALDYNVSTISSLVPFELDENGRQRTGSQIASLMFLKNGKLIDLGQNINHTQTVTFNIKPKLPLGGYSKYLDMSGSFITTYSWYNPLQTDPIIQDIAKSANWKNSIRFNTGFKLKSFTEDLFNISNPKMVKRNGPSDTTSGLAKDIFKVFKTIFLDFERFDITFNQTGSSINPGVYGGTGITNFWSFWKPNDNIYGPSLAYQLGLVPDPHGGFTMNSSNSFPFFRFNTYTGLRPPNAVLQDNFQQKSSLEIKTSRQLWEGATLDLNWLTEFGFNKNQTVLTDSLGHPTFTNVIVLESLDRTYFSMPPIFGINISNNTVDHVIQLYNARSKAIDALTADSVTKNQMRLLALSESFRTGLETFSIFGGTLGTYLPAINWAFRWEGLEKWDIWNKLLKSLSIEHAYTSKYSEIAQVTDNGKSIQSQMVQVGFQPLLGINVKFSEEKLKGVLTSSLRLITTSSYNLNSSNGATISRQSTTELQIQGNYALRGFEFPFLGINLKNDIEFIFFTSYKHNINATYDIFNYQGENGQTINGSTQVSIEPRVRYSLSKRLTASFYVRYDGTFTAGAAQPGYSTTQVGFDLRISIAGGR
jgi:cell surface protein SprA